MPYKVRNEFHFNLNQEVYYREDNSLSYIVERYYDYLEAHNRPRYLIQHTLSGETFVARQCQLTLNPNPSKYNTQFRIEDIAYYKNRKFVIRKIVEKRDRIYFKCLDEYFENVELSLSDISFLKDVSLKDCSRL